MDSLPPFSLEAKNLKTGIYEHYKGHRYRVLSVARHSETLDEYVVYQADYGDKGTWIRPLKMFVETVWIDGKGEIPRFRLIDDGEKR